MSKEKAKKIVAAGHVCLDITPGFLNRPAEQIGEYVPTDSMIEAEGENTSYSVVIAPKGIDRMFLHCPGANDTFSSKDLDYEQIRGADLFHLRRATALKRCFRRQEREIRPLRHFYMRSCRGMGGTNACSWRRRKARPAWKRMTRSAASGLWKN